MCVASVCMCVLRGGLVCVCACGCVKEGRKVCVHNRCVGENRKICISFNTVLVSVSNSNSSHGAVTMPTKLPRVQLY